VEEMGLLQICAHEIGIRIYHAGEAAHWLVYSALRLLPDQESAEVAAGVFAGGMKEQIGVGQILCWSY
jgi:hypothetical protein